MNNEKITVNELQLLLDNNKPVSILDIRPIEQRNEWKFPNSIHADVYAGLKNGDRKVFDFIDLPKEIPIVTVCAGGVSAAIATDILNEKGYNAYTLEGGINAWKNQNDSEK